MTNDEILELFHSEETLTQIRKRVGIRYGTLAELWKSHYGVEAFEERRRIRYRNSKLAEKNPMRGRVKELHPGWLSGESISSRKGYIRVKAPDWYEGVTDGRYVDEHVVVYCASRGFSKVPSGFCIHHLDMSKTNNDPKNLIMLTNADHRLLHAWIDRAVVQRLSE